VAVNPFKKVALYGDECINAYRNKTMDSPHVYAIADSALREMKRGQSAVVVHLFADTLCMFVFEKNHLH
jgi:myosin heavy subunit